MKCQFCGLENAVAPDRCSVQVHWPAMSMFERPVADESLAVIFGIWNQRKGELFQICGACLAERLTVDVPIIVPGRDLTIIQRTP